MRMTRQSVGPTGVVTPTLCVKGCGGGYGGHAPGRRNSEAVPYGEFNFKNPFLGMLLQMKTCPADLLERYGNSEKASYFAIRSLTKEPPFIP